MGNRNKKKLSLNEVKNEILIVNEVIKVAFDDFIEQMYKQSIITSIWEDVLKLRERDIVTKGEFVKEVKRLKEDSLVKDARQLISGFASENLKESSDEIYFFCLQMVLKEKNEAESFYPQKTYKNPQKPTYRELQRTLSRSHNVLDFFVEGFTKRMRLKVIHTEVLEGVIEQYLSDERTLSQLKAWCLKWENCKADSNKSGLELCQHLEVPDLYANSDTIEELIFNRVKAFMNTVYKEFKLQLKKAS